MDTGIEIAQPIWLDPDLLTDFIDELRESGYRIGVSQYIAVQDLMVALANQGKLPENSERLRTLIAPILCSSPTEQEDFQYRFDDWVELIKLKDRPKDELGIKAAILNNIKKRRWRFRSLILLFIVSIFSVVFLQISTPTPLPKTTSQTISPSITASPSTSIQPTVSPSITASPSISVQPTVSPSITASPSISIQPTVTPSITASPSISIKPTVSPSIAISDSDQKWQNNVAFSLLALCLAVLGWRLWWHWRTQLFLERRSTNQQPELHNISIDSFKHSLLPLVPFIQIARNFRQRIRISSNDLDIDRTIEASLRRGGWLTPIYGFRQILPEYLFLIDRSSFRDHQAKFADEIIDNLRHNGVFVTSYYFDDNPLICFPSDGVNHPQKLNEIAVKHHQHRVVIITDVDNLYDSATGEIESWVSKIDTWSDRAILTPKPVESWGYRELELEQQFIVLPTNSNGFQILGQLFSQGKTNFFLAEGNQTPLPEILRTRPHRWIENTPPDTEQIDVLLSSLQQYLGKDGFYWLSACAVYPELHWNITIYLGNAIKTEDGNSLLETSSVINLARLPWFRYGYMPNWFRDRLIKTFTQNQERTVRAVLQNLLITAISGAKGGFQLRFAKHNYRYLNKIANSILNLLSRRLSENSPLRDYTFLGFMLGKPKLAVKVPSEFSRFLKKSKKNHWLIGIGIITVVLCIPILYYSGDIIVGLMKSLKPSQNQEPQKTKMWNLEIGTEIRTLKGHDNYVNSVSFSPDGKTLASGSYDKTIKLWNLETGKEIRTIKGHDNSVMSVSFSPDGKTLASGSTDNTIKLWNLGTGTEIRTFVGHANSVMSVSFSPDGKTLASGSTDNTIKLWYLEIGMEIRTFEGHDSAVYSISFSPDGKTLATGSFDKTIIFWDVLYLKAGKGILTLKGHDRSVNSVSFSHDGKTLASGSTDNTIKLWNLETGTEIRTFEGHSNSVMSVSFSPDGKTLASGSSDKTIKLWNIEIGIDRSKNGSFPTK